MKLQKLRKKRRYYDFELMTIYTIVGIVFFIYGWNNKSLVPLVSATALGLVVLYFVFKYLKDKIESKTQAKSSL